MNNTTTDAALTIAAVVGPTASGKSSLALKIVESNKNIKRTYK